MYIGRGDHLGNLIPGKVNPNHGCCYVAYDGSEHAKNNYQVLTRDLDSSTEFEWVNAGSYYTSLPDFYRNSILDD